MIRATTGTWVNYGTTFIFQILFAARFGTGHEAAAFAITFGVAISLAGILVSTVQTVAVPRLVAPGGRVWRGTLGFLWKLCGAAAAMGVLVGLFAARAAAWIAPHLSLNESELTVLLRITAVFLVLRFVASSLGAIGLARGNRFIPAVSPAIPSIIGAVPLLLVHHISVEHVYLLLVAGSLVEIGLLLATVVAPMRLAAGSSSSTARAAVAMLLVYILLALIAPLERIFAAAHSPADAAQYDYAIRMVRSGQQLLIGGLFIATLGDWSSFVARGSRELLRESLMSALVLAAVVLLLATAIAMVATHDAVALVFQHGEFTSHDTAAVTRIILLALPGFCAESLVLILSSAAAALKHHGILVINGVSRFVGSVLLFIVLAPRWGANGVAIAYSATAVETLVVLVFAAYRMGLWPSGCMTLVRRCVPLLAGTGGTAAVLLVVAGSIPGFVRAGVVCLVFLVLLVRLQPMQMLKPLRMRQAA